MKGVKFTSREKVKALTLWRQEGADIFYTAKKCKCTERSLWRWKAAYDGTLESLENKSSRPHTPHPNAHTQDEHDYIMKIYAENPDVGYSELYGELRVQYAYKRHFMSMYNYIRKNCLRPVQVYEKYIPLEYETPVMLGLKMQMDVKFVPTECLTGHAKKNHDEIGEKFYQYTIIDEASRERFLYPYREHSGYSTVDFVKRAIVYFGYASACIQTDNGTEFTNPKGTGEKKIHIVDALLNKLHIKHQLIRPYTPRHNGKVERSHRNDQERFYNFHKFRTFDELKIEMGKYLSRSNKIPSSALRNREGKRVWQSPLDKRVELMEILKEESNQYGVRFLKKSSRTA
jgi:transposase InsO family protein